MIRQQGSYRLCWISGCVSLSRVRALLIGRACVLSLRTALYAFCPFCGLGPCDGGLCFCFVRSVSTLLFLFLRNGNARAFCLCFGLGLICVCVLSSSCGCGCPRALCPFLRWSFRVLWACFQRLVQESLLGREVAREQQLERSFLSLSPFIFPSLFKGIICSWS